MPIKVSKELVLVAILIIVFGSGFAIYFYRVAKTGEWQVRPELDLSMYENPGAALGELKQTIISIDAPVTEGKEVVVEPVMEEPGVYFKKDFFTKNTFDELALQMNLFLADFPSLQNIPVRYLSTSKDIEIELPSVGRDKLIKDFENNILIEKIEMVAPPVWKLTFRQEKLAGEVSKFLENFSEVKLKSVLPDNSGYIALIGVTDFVKSQSDLEKLGKEYSDVVKVVFGK